MSLEEFLLQTVFASQSGAFERVYLVYIYVEHAADIFVWRPQIAEEIFKRWDIERTRISR